MSWYFPFAILITLVLILVATEIVLWIAGSIRDYRLDRKETLQEIAQEKDLLWFEICDIEKEHNVQ